MSVLIALLCVTAVFFVPSQFSVLAQRPPFAGQRPNGYHDRLLNNMPMADTSVVPLDNRFGGNSNTASRSDIPPERLPTAALGDPMIVDTLNQRPIDQRPFWLVNYEAIEAQKNSGSRPQQPSGFDAATLTNRFAADNGINNNGPLFIPEIDANHQQILGTAHDPGNYMHSQQEIVYPQLNGPTGDHPSVPVTVNADRRTSTVITLNGQPFLLTPLSTAPPAVLQQQQPVFYFD